MLCPNCSHDLGDGILPVRCPECGHSLANLSDAPGVVEGAKRAAERKKLLRGSATIEHVRHPWDGHGKAFGIGIFLLALVIICFMLWHLQACGGVSPNNVVGWRLERAQAALEQKGFKVEVTEEFDDGEPGFVLSMNPDSNARLAPGTAITLVISKARVMPDIIGKSKDDAQKLLDEAGLTYEFVEVIADGDENIVLSANIAAGNKASSKNKIKVEVSKKRTVPDILNKSEADATNALTMAQLKAKVVYVAATADQKEGVVVAVDPEVGTAVEKDAVVTISVTQSYIKKIEDNAKAVVTAVYSGSPASDGYACGGVIKQYVDSSVTIGGSSAAHASNRDVYYALVKNGKSLPAGVDQKLGMLPRTLLSVDSLVGDEKGHVSASVTVRWDWSALGGEYSGVTSTDTHTVTLNFTKEGKLTSFNDPQADVPSYTVS
ncbi:MAG: PASTA domain-containing protein [Atopobium sp.]|uniref:PASTA domain-containing protein n=2 Tax=Atopobium sp. TaxID=1872650 RepID=UPI002A81AB53|nr:PASTA domain-containing protein [Atopobium sp.]MDY4522468.1 PASTA domain-containing protein [Atopobium sp.]